MLTSDLAVLAERGGDASPPAHPIPSILAHAIISFNSWSSVSRGESSGSKSPESAERNIDNTRGCDQVGTWPT